MVPKDAIFSRRFPYAVFLYDNGSAHVINTVSKQDLFVLENVSTGE